MRSEISQRSGDQRSAGVRREPKIAARRLASLGRALDSRRDASWHSEARPAPAPGPIQERTDGPGRRHCTPTRSLLRIRHLPPHLSSHRITSAHLRCLRVIHANACRPAATQHRLPRQRSGNAAASFPPAEQRAVTAAFARSVAPTPRPRFLPGFTVPCSELDPCLVVTTAWVSGCATLASRARPHPQSDPAHFARARI